MCFGTFKRNNGDRIYEKMIRITENCIKLKLV